MQNITIFGLTLIEVLFYFSIYAFIGWCLEVAYATLNTGTFVNRGFLNGPVCPIYGFGVIAVIICLDPVKNNLLLLFVFSVILTSLIEYLTGFVLEKVFHNKWWDYSRFPYNINGYICLKFSILWGIACVFVIRIIHPLITNLVNAIPTLLESIVLIIIVLLLLSDFGTTVFTVLKLNIRLAKIEEISIRIRQKSDALGKDISKDTLELEKIYSELTKKKNILHRRLIKAFPNIKSIKYSEALEVLKRNAIKYKENNIIK